MPRRSWMLLPLALLACGGEGSLTIRDRGGQSAGAGGAGDGLAGAPTIPTAGSGGGAGQATGGQGGEAGAPITPIRTVSQRNPFGNVAASDNLLWDGDFEWSGAFLSQYAWSSGKSWKTSGVPEIEVLAACRSGMKCARVKKGGSIGGIGVSPRTPTTRFRGWVKIESGEACSRVQLYLSSCFGYDDLKDPAESSSAEPDGEGWCRYEAERPTLDKTPCLFLLNKSKAGLLVDDFYLGPGTSAPSSGASSAVDAEATAQVREIREDLRLRRQGDDRPPLRPPTRFREVRRVP